MTYLRKSPVRRAVVQIEKRPHKQPWRWFALAGNGKPVGWSGEFHVRRSVPVNGAELLFGEDTTVILREPGKPDRVLRRAVCECDTCTEHRKADQ